MNDAILNILIKAKDEASKVLKDVGGSMDDVKDKAGNMSKNFMVAGGIMTGAGIAGALAVKDWVSASASAEAEMAKFEVTMANSFGKSPEMFRKVRDSALETGKAFVQLGFDDEDTANAFAKLASKTKDVGKAQEYITLAADMARMKHIDLGTAVDQVGKILMDKGSKVLTDYGIKAIKGGQAVDYLSQIQAKASGQAEAYANTFAGSQERMAVTVQNLKEELGSALLPIFTKVATAVLNLIDKFNKINPNILPVIGVVVAVGSAFALIVGPLLVLIGLLGSGALVAGFATLSAVLLPAIGIIAAVVAVAIAVYEAFTHWSEIVSFVQGVWTAVVTFLMNLWTSVTTTLTSIWTSIVTFFTNIFVTIFTYLTNIYTFWFTIFNAIYTVVFNILNFIYTAWVFIFEAMWALIQIIFWSVYTFIEGILTQLWAIFGDKLTAIYNTTMSILTSIWNFISSIFNTIMNFIKTTWNSISSFISEKLTQINSFFTEKFNAIRTTVMTIFSSVYDWFSSKLNAFWSKVDEITQKVKNAFEWMSQQIQNALHAIKFPHLKIGSGSVSVGGHEINYPTIGVDWYKQGGWVKNTGLAMVHEGEYVLSKNMLNGNTPISSQISTNNSRNSDINIQAIINNPLDFDLLVNKLTWAMNYG